MKRKKGTILITLFLLTFSMFFVFTACKKDNDPTPRSVKDVDANGLTQDINNLVPASVIEEMERLQMPIFGGNAPPVVTGAFKAEKFILLSSNDTTDFIGFRYPNYLVEFSSLNLVDLTVNVRYSTGPESGQGLGGFIVGQGDNFSIFMEVKSVINNDSASFAHVISGSLDTAGIKNLYFANFMVNDNGDPNNVWIEIGQGRVAYDSDSLSIPIPSFP